MKLLMDIGNSCVKWATLHEGGKLSPQQRFCYQQEGLIDKLAEAFIQSGNSMHWTAGWNQIWVSNVAGPDLATALTDWTKATWGITPILVKTAGYDCGVTNGYHQPQQLGIDRWLALIGAHYLERGPLCVVDCGTAVTLDVLTAAGVHLGGLIMPGMSLMYQALLTDTHALAAKTTRLVDFKRPIPTTHLAQDTDTGIILGTLYAIAGWVEYNYQCLRTEGQKYSLILTGGDSAEIAKLLTCPYRQVPDLVLQGLAVMVGRSSGIEAGVGAEGRKN